MESGLHVLQKRLNGQGTMPGFAKAKYSLIHAAPWLLAKLQN
jgi:hypothetical protein